MSLRLNWGLAGIALTALVLALSGTPARVAAHETGGCPLYRHIADLSANGMANRVWSVGEVSPDEPGPRFDDSTSGVPPCTESVDCTLGDACTTGICTSDPLCTDSALCTGSESCTTGPNCTAGAGCTGGYSCTLGDFCTYSPYCTSADPPCTQGGSQYCTSGDGCTFGPVCVITPVRAMSWGEVKELFLDER